MKRFFYVVFLYFSISVVAVFDYTDQKSFFSEYALAELSISSIAQNIDKTKTIVGKNFFKEMLLKPTRNIDLINQRQCIIKKLVENDTLYFSIKRELEIITKNETALLIYQDKNHRFHTDIKRLMPINPVLKKALSRSPLLLECFYLALFGDASFGVIKQFGLLGFIKELAFLIDGSESSFNIIRAVSFGFGEFFKQHNIFQTQIALKKNGEPQGLSKLIHLGYVNNIYHKLLEKNVPPVFAGLLSIMPLVYYDFKLVETMSEAYKNSADIISIMQELQTYLVSLSAYFSAYNRLKELIETSQLKSYQLFGNAKQIQANKSLLSAIIALQSSTFDQARKYAFYHGKALHVHLMVSDAIDVLNNTSYDIAELDVYTAVATLIREQRNDKPFCFVNFVQSDELCIVANKSWVPLLQAPVKDDIVFDKNLSKVLLTGPNGSGKSILLKKIGVLICIAQVFGVAFAETCTMSIFSYIRTALDCKGDSDQGYSKFTQQKTMMQSFVDLSQSIKGIGKKAVFLIDEAFSGTVEDEASKRVLEFLNAVNAINNSIVIISTHLEDPVRKRLERSNFIDYCMKVHVVKDSGNQNSIRFEKTFRFEPGIMGWWFDNAALRSLYIEQN